MHPCSRWCGSWALVAAVCACGPDEPDFSDPPPREIEVGESVEIELRDLRLDVTGFENHLTLEDLQQMPRSILADVWLLDLDATPLMLNALQNLERMEAEELAGLSVPAQNMRGLLLMSADTANLEGTQLAELSELAAGVSVLPQHILRELFETSSIDPLIPRHIVADVILEQVVSTHPNARWRRGSETEEYPDGRHPVAPKSLPVSLADLITGFESLEGATGPRRNIPAFCLARAAFRLSTTIFR